MNRIGIDLSLRSTGICASYGGKIKFALVANKSADEALLAKNTADIIAFIKEQGTPDVINIEGLSFGSISGSKDILAGNFWHLRVELSKAFPDVQINIIPVLSWRSPLFNKEERKAAKDSDKRVKELKKALKGIKGNARKAAMEGHEGDVTGACIKYQTFLKLPEAIRNQISKITMKDARYDLTDSYFVCLYNS